MTDNPYRPPETGVGDAPTARDVAQRPANVRFAARLLWISLVVSIPISIREYQDGASDSNGHFLLWFILVLYAIAIAINVFIWRGANAARIALVVFTALNLMSFVGAMQLILRYPTGDLVAIAISMLLDVAAIVLVYTRPGALWFRRGRA